MASSLMRWSNLFIIFRREVRDQIRDRRTLFMIFVLPILLYPILGIGVTKFAMALEQKPRVVIVVGTEYLPSTPACSIRPATASIRPFSTHRQRPSGCVVRQEPASRPLGRPTRAREQAIRDGDAAAVMVIPPDLPEQLQREKRTRSTSRSSTTASTSPARSPYLRLKELVERWRKSIVDGRLKRDQKTQSYAEPIQVKAR